MFRSLRLFASFSVCLFLSLTLFPSLTLFISNRREIEKEREELHAREGKSNEKKCRLSLSPSLFLTLPPKKKKKKKKKDVRWCRGSIAERIFAPLAERIREGGGEILGGTAVEQIGVDERTNSITSLRAREAATGKTVQISDLDAVVFAVGVKGMQTLVLNNPEALGTRDEFSRTMRLKTIDCVSVRLWFDSPRKTQFPANVLSGFDGEATGGTFFNLNQIQDEYMKPGAVS